MDRISVDTNSGKLARPLRGLSLWFSVTALQGFGGAVIVLLVKPRRVMVSLHVMV